MNKPLTCYGEALDSRLFLGSALYPSLSVMTDAMKASETSVITLGLRRQSPEKSGGDDFWRSIKSLDKKLLPNTAGCHSAKEAIILAEMSRELLKTDWIKLEVIGDDYTLQPDPYETVAAANVLINKGFKVFPYCTDDLVFCQKLVDVGCELLMPWGAPIGTGKGLMNPYALDTLRHRFDKLPLIIDAGIGKPSHAAKAMEMGFDAVLLNTAVAEADDPVMMAEAFNLAIKAGRLAYEAGTMGEKQTASPSTPVIGTPFWHQE